MHGNPSATDRGCDIGLVFAMAIEADAFDRRVTERAEVRGAGPTFHEGRVAGVRVAWCVSGIGREAATRAARLLIAGHGPQLIVSAGFAGGLDPSLERGSVVRPRAVVAEAAGPRILLASLGPARADGPLLVSVEAIAATAACKRGLAKRTGAALVDMETHAVARVATEAGLPCVAVRVISDDAAQELPADVTALARPQSAMRRLGSVLGTLGRRPTAAFDLWRTYERAVVDGRTLAAALEAACRELVGNQRLTGPPAAAPGDCAAGPPPAT